MGFKPMQLLGRQPGRLPEQGRIRLGRKVSGVTRQGKAYTRPDKLTTLRFTSADRAAIDACARMWGGTVEAWEDQWEVITEAKEVEVVLPREPLGGGPVYELWSGGGRQRQCDGETCTTPRKVGEDDIDFVEVACICNARQREECKPTTRLKVILPQLPFGGVWRLETHSWNAAAELPAMVDAVASVTGGGFVKAFLGIREEEKVIEGKTKSFIVPFLRLDASLLEAVTGGAVMQALPAPTPVLEPVDDDEPIDGELVTDTEGLGDWLVQLRARARAAGITDDAVAGACLKLGLGDELTAEALTRLGSMVSKVEAGTHELVVQAGEAKLLARVADRG